MTSNLGPDARALYAAIKPAITPLGLLDRRIEQEGYEPSRAEVVEVIAKLHAGLAEALDDNGPEWALIRSTRAGLRRDQIVSEGVTVEEIRAATRLANSTVRARLKQ